MGVFEELAPADLSSALGSLKRLHRQVVIQPNAGLGYESFLRWALCDIEEAEKALNPDDCERAAVNATIATLTMLSSVQGYANFDLRATAGLAGDLTVAAELLHPLAKPRQTVLARRPANELKAASVVNYREHPTALRLLQKPTAPRSRPNGR